MVWCCVAAGCNNSSQLVHFGFQNPQFRKVGKNKFDEQETAGKVQQSTIEFAAVTSKNTVLQFCCNRHILAQYSSVLIISQ